jgi:hypothetical protein
VVELPGSEDRNTRLAERAPPAKDAPAIGMSISHQVAEDRNVVFQGFLPADCEQGELSSFLDKVFKASERQKAIVQLPQLRKRLAHLEKVHKRVTEDMFRLDEEASAAEAAAQSAMSSSDRRNPKLSAQQLAHREKNKADRANAETTYKRHAEDIADLKNEIADLEKTVAEG